MPFVSMASAKNKIDGSIKRQVLDFLQKLQVDDALPGLHIEPMENARDRRARTGRVNDSWRAVLFRMESGEEPHYVYYGTWPHDEAIKIARSTVLKLNLALGAPEFEDRGLPAHPEGQPYIEPPAPPAPAGGNSAPKPETLHSGDTTPDEHPATAEWENRLPGAWTAAQLTAQVGASTPNAERALAATTPAELNACIDALPEAQGLVLLGLANGERLEDIRDELGLTPVTDGPEDDDAAIDRALRDSTGGAKAGFVFVGDNAQQLEHAFESLDIESWRVFLHPEQQKFVDLRWGGSTRIGGGAGTGKTVVLLHRARALARENAEARILLTTFTRTLAGALQQQLKKLDPGLSQVGLGESGVVILGMDQVASQVLQKAGKTEVQAAQAAVLGAGRNALAHRATHTGQSFRAAVERSNPEVPEPLLEPAFLEQEYVSVVLANGVVDEKDYLRASRTGRGTALNRAARKEVWKVFAQFRRSQQMSDSVTFPELAAIAAWLLRARAERGEALPFDHVLVDEAQDFHAAHWLLLRALVAKGPNDVFIAEDSHQRIYGQRVSLSRFGIDVRGRARRLRLNYRTTAENLAYAVSLLEGTEFQDIADEGESTKGYRSVRSGPVPTLVHAPDRTAEELALVRHLKRWIEDERVAPDAIAVLVRADVRVKAATQVLEDAGIANSSVKGGGTAGKGKVSVMTMHSSKGMEFERVVVMGADEIPAHWSYEDLPEAEQQDARLRERSLLYVAATRARDELVMTWTDNRN